MRSPWFWGSVALLLALAITSPSGIQSQPFDFAQGQPLDSAQGQPIGPARDGPAAGRDQVIIGDWQEPDILHPLFAGSASPSFSTGAVMRTLFLRDVQLDHRGNIFPLGVERLPNLAEGTWKVDGDTMVLTWRLRPRRWHDGPPVTCADYVFTHKVAVDVRVPVGPLARKFANRIANIACPEGAAGRTVVVTWRERDPFAQFSIASVNLRLPRHKLEHFYRASPGRFDATGYGLDPNMTIGDGPFRLMEWRRGQSLTVESVGDHPVVGTPRLKQITWRFFANRDALIRNMLAGSIDVISAEAMTFRHAVELERQVAGRVKVFFEPSGAWEHIDVNLDNPLLQDVRVRRALAHGINRIQIVQQLFFGKQPVAHGYLPPGHPGYTDSVPRYPYDPARARALLREAGFAPGSDGILRNSAGQPLALELNTTAGNPDREQVAQLIQKQLREIGIEIMILNFPGRVLLQESTQRRRFKALIVYAWNWAPLHGCDLYYTSDGIPSETNGWTGSNFPGYRNTEMDDLCKAAQREVDSAKRRTLLQATSRIFARDLPALPLYYRVNVGAAKVGLQNYTVPSFAGGSGTSETWNAHQWFWESR